MSKRKEREAELRAKMKPLLDELNQLDDEAVEKLIWWPTEHTLINELRIGEVVNVILIAGIVAIIFVGVLCYLYERFSDLAWCVLGGIAVTGMAVCKIVEYRQQQRRRDEDIKPAKLQHVHYVSEEGYESLVDDLKTLKRNLALYDQQYAEAEDYIGKFRECVPEVEALGGKLEIVLEVNNFHANLWLRELRIQNMELIELHYAHLRDLIDYYR